MTSLDLMWCESGDTPFKQTIIRREDATVRENWLFCVCLTYSHLCTNLYFVHVVDYLHQENPSAYQPRMEALLRNAIEKQRLPIIQVASTSTSTPTSTSNSTANSDTCWTLWDIWNVVVIQSDVKLDKILSRSYNWRVSRRGFYACMYLKSCGWCYCMYTIVLWTSLFLQRRSYGVVWLPIEIR